jgi:serine/threonine-protein kinase
MWGVNEALALRSKVCAACGGSFPADALFCPADGSPLQSAAAAERDSDDLYLGQEISGHIEIRRTVGVGAMGRVYRAFQRGIDRDVAVKILHRELSANAQLVARFTREAKVASRLQHPNVVQVLLAGQLPDGALYMVMEYLDGLSLQSALAAAGGALPLPRALHIALQLCEAVGEAHAQGIVHRDLKPENVMLVRRGADHDFVKVLDFGIARFNWGEQSIATAAGLIFGTARYISPEGAQGNAVGPASDVYAIGTMLYQMLAGRTPFDGDQAVGVLVQQIHDPAPPLRSIPRAAYVPEPIADVVMASLAKDPASREPDARSLGQAIFDAARRAGLSPDEFSRPMLRRQPSAMQLPPVERTKQLDLPADLRERMTPSDNVNVDVVGQRPTTAATVKWEPPAEFQARLAQATADQPTVVEASPSAPASPRTRVPSTVDATIDDMTVDAIRPESSPVLLPTPVPTAVPRTAPGAPEPTPRTAYVPPVAEATNPVPRPPSVPDAYPSSPAIHRPSIHDDVRSRAWLFVVFLLLGASIAGVWAWKSGKIGGDADEERVVARASDAMFRNRFHEPPGDNVKDITDEGLRRWPNDRKLYDIRSRAASELASQAIGQRAAGDVLEALKLAKIAHELDPRDAAAKRLVEQYEAEIAGFNASAASTLSQPDKPPPVTSTKPPRRTTPTPPPSTSAPPPPPAHPSAEGDYKALLDVSSASVQLGQTVSLTARIAPNKGDFDAPGFTVSGPGIPGGVRMPAQNPSPGVFTASYAFLEPGKFEVSFSTSEHGRPITAKRTVSAATAPPSPAPNEPTPAPPGSVKWM